VAPGTLPTPAIQGKIASIAAKAGESVESATENYLAARQPSGGLSERSRRRPDRISL
jgi:3-hydroxybutyrate dehydrogenase